MTLPASQSQMVRRSDRFSEGQANDRYVKFFVIHSIRQNGPPLIFIYLFLSSYLVFPEYRKANGLIAHPSLGQPDPIMGLQNENT